jgi:hypothetical protein
LFTSRVALFVRRMAPSAERLVNRKRISSAIVSPSPVASHSLLRYALSVF